MPENSLPWEAGVVGSIALNLRFDPCQQLAKTLQAQDFSSLDYQELWRLLTQAQDWQDYLTQATAQKLQAAYFEARESEYGGLNATYEWCVSRLKKAGLARRIRAELAQLCQSASDEELPRLLARLAEQTGRGVIEELADYPERQAQAFLESLEEDDRHQRLSTGLPALDRATGGLRRGNVSVLGAFPSAGKTALALNVVRSCLEQAKTAVIFSLEMSRNQLWERLLAGMSRISYESIERRKLSTQELTVARKIVEPSARCIYPFDDCLSVERMTEKVMAIRPDLVVVDFLQYVRVEGQRILNTADRLEHIIGELKSLAKNSYCPCHILILSQHSREAKSEGVSMFSLKGSSGIEQGGDYIMILDRPHVKDANEPPEKATLSLVKNKFGRLAKVPLYFDGAHQSFRELAEGERYPEPLQCRATKEELPW